MTTTPRVAASTAFLLLFLVLGSALAGDGAHEGGAGADTPCDPSPTCGYIPCCPTGGAATSTSGGGPAAGIAAASEPASATLTKHTFPAASASASAAASSPADHGALSSEPASATLTKHTITSAAPPKHGVTSDEIARIVKHQLEKAGRQRQARRKKEVLNAFGGAIEGDKPGGEHATKGISAETIRRIAHFALQRVEGEAGEQRIASDGKAAGAGAEAGVGVGAGATLTAAVAAGGKKAKRDGMTGGPVVNDKAFRDIRGALSNLGGVWDAGDAGSEAGGEGGTRKSMLKQDATQEDPTLPDPTIDDSHGKPRDEVGRELRAGCAWTHKGERLLRKRVDP